MLGLIDRLDYIRDLGIGSERTGRIHAARLDRLVEEGAIMTVQHIADLEPARRTAILVAQVANLEIRLTDATLAMFEKYIGSLFTKEDVIDFDVCEQCGIEQNLMLAALINDDVYRRRRCQRGREDRIGH